MGNVFSAVINGIEHVAQDMESLVSQAVNEIETLGIAVTEGISWLVKFFIQEGEDPVTVISKLSGRISSMGGDVIGTLEELSSGIMTDGLTGFAQKKASQALAPMQEALQKNSAQGSALAQVHQTTLKTMKTHLDALTVQGNVSTLAWQGQSADAMYASFGDISGTISDLTSAFENGGPQDKLNIICGGALAGIIVIGGIVLLCELVVTCIVAIPGLASGPGDLVILGGGAGLMALTLEVLETLIALDLLAWLLGSIVIYVITHPISLPHTSTPNNGPRGGNTVQTSASNLPLNPGQVVPGGRIYIPPKRSHGQPVRARGGGFIDAQGNIWEWAPGGAQHGGPHWDVQHPNGTHTNVAPNGKVIGKDNFPNNDSLKK